MKNFHSCRANLLSHFISINPGVTLCTFHSLSIQTLLELEKMEMTAGPGIWSTLMWQCCRRFIWEFLSITWTLINKGDVFVLQTGSREFPSCWASQRLWNSKNKNGSIFGGIKIVWPENSQGDYILHPSLCSSINVLHLSLQLLQGTKLEDDFLSHSTDFLSRALSTHACQHNGRARRLGGGVDKMAKAKPETTDGRRWRRWRLCWMNLQAWVILACGVQ